MKRLITLLAATAMAASLCLAGSVTGQVLDQNCAKAGHKDASCAANCIKGGTPAVVVTADGKIYEVAEQAKLAEHAGMQVTVTGTIEGMKITSVEKVEKTG
ncbi:MAG: DUF5818 domain-containing protein [bacterium]|nr:DUF5818 domain-containing protein [bacterium]